MLQTSDATWEAYNDYGGNSLYTCTVACPPGNPLAYKAAYAVSYNRPFDGALATDGGASYLCYAEYQMIRFLEAERLRRQLHRRRPTSTRAAALLLEPQGLHLQRPRRVLVGRASARNVEAARDAGVNLAFFSGNEMFWKTRWATSIDGSNTPYRTLVTYKETHFNAPDRPAGPADLDRHLGATRASARPPTAAARRTR